MTGRELIAASLRRLGVLASGETMEAQDASNGLVTLNDMIDSFSNENLLIYTKIEETFTLVPGTQQYTMGSGATFNTPRPIRVERAIIRDTRTTPNVDYPMRVINKDEWADLRVKSITTSYPLFLYAEGTFPNETLNIYPVPNEALDLILFTWKPLSLITTLDTSISLPPGYNRMLIANLAIELAPEYGRPTPQEVLKTAVESKANIKRSNHRPRYLRINDVPADPSDFDFNIYTGDYDR